MTLEERANAIAACRNGVVPGSHLHKRLTTFAVQMMREAIEQETVVLRATLATLASELTCRNGDVGHYCPNCDRSLFDARELARRASK